ncbi:MAG: hypothetical protein WC143_04005 [Eubacteriales bacterium]
MEENTALPYEDDETAEPAPHNKSAGEICGESLDEKAKSASPVQITFTPEGVTVTRPITIEYGSDYKFYDIGDVYIDSLGRVLDLSLTLKRIAPCREVAIGISLNELDFFGHEHRRGFKAIRYPGHPCGCRDVKIRCIRWVLPEFYDEMGSPGAICNARKFVARVTANYITTNVPICC